MMMDKTPQACLARSFLGDCLGQSRFPQGACSVDDHAATSAIRVQAEVSKPFQLEPDACTRLISKAKARYLLIVHVAVKMDTLDPDKQPYT